MNFPHSQMCTEPPVPAGRSCESGFSLRYPRKSWNYRYLGQSYKPHPVNTLAGALQGSRPSGYSLPVQHGYPLPVYTAFWIPDIPETKAYRYGRKHIVRSGKSLFPKTSFWNWSLSHKGQHHNPLPGSLLLSPSPQFPEPHPERDTFSRLDLAFLWQPWTYPSLSYPHNPWNRNAYWQSAQMECHAPFAVSPWSF